VAGPRAVFVAYCLLIAGGIVLSIAIGVTHR
jgi:hypothetical protein